MPRPRSCRWSRSTPRTPRVGGAIAGLATAYNGYYTANGKDKAANATLTTAINQINKLCPGAGATA